MVKLTIHYSNGRIEISEHANSEAAFKYVQDMNSRGHTVLSSRLTW